MRGIVKRLLRSSSIDIRSYSERNIFALRLVRFLNDRGIDFVIDVGANRGQFGETLYRHGYRGRMLSFEPLPGAIAELQAKAAATGHDWRVAEPMALAAEEGTAELTVAMNGASSSLLNQSETLGKIAPFTRPIERISVRTARLDRVLTEYGLVNHRIALKIDTQGSERSVLEGAAGILPSIWLVLLEVSIAGLYVGQPQYFELDAYLREHGLRLIEMEQGFRDPQTLELLEYDAVYARDAGAGRVR